jgi:hypothetical protein
MPIHWLSVTDDSAAVTNDLAVRKEARDAVGTPKGHPWLRAGCILLLSTR